MAPVSKHNIDEAVTGLLKELISIPSLSREENATAEKIQSFLDAQGLKVFRKGNNVWTRNKFHDAAKLTILLNSHHDTVKANGGYTRNPHQPAVEEGKLYGLGSNDAGGPLVALMGAFLNLYETPDLNYNLVYAATAEEEISGTGGVESIITELGPIDLALVGEPTQMKMAVAERGLLVLDCSTNGKAGHAARGEGINSIYLAIPDIDWFRSFNFDKTSYWLGPVGMNVTAIHAGAAHNQVPALCNFVVDIRLNECYTHEEILEIVRKNVKCSVSERSTRIKPSFIETTHPFVVHAKDRGISLFGSPTTSDMALMPWPSVKIGPGDSARSHSADEFIFLREIEDGIKIYTELLETYSTIVKTPNP